MYLRIRFFIAAISLFNAIKKSYAQIHHFISREVSNITIHYVNAVGPVGVADVVCFSDQHQRSGKERGKEIKNLTRKSDSISSLKNLVSFVVGLPDGLILFLVYGLPGLVLLYFLVKILILLIV